MHLYKKCLAMWILILYVINITDSAPTEVDADQSDNINLTFPDCGKRTPKVEKRDVIANFRRSNRLERWNQVTNPAIIGGQESKPNSWPWVAAIFYVSHTKETFLCGGSLISRRYVLTAAHCFRQYGDSKDDIDPSKFVVFLGSHINDDGTKYQVSCVVIHPGYKFDPYNFYNDIALLKMEKEVELSAKVLPVCLPSKGGLWEKVQEEGEFTVMGWGKVNQNDSKGSCKLREVNVQMLPQEECDKKYQKVEEILDLDLFPEGVTEDQICAQDKEGGKDACQGDSGGPLVSKLKDDEDTYAQIGVVSFGLECGKPEYPGVYTRVSRHTKWLYDNTDLGR